MGIKGIYPHLEKVPNSFRSTKLTEWKGKKWAIDSNGLLYKFLYGNQPNSHIHQFASLVIDLFQHGIEGWFVFDGRPPKEKDAVRKARNSVRETHKKKVFELETELKSLKEEVGVKEEESVFRSPSKFQHLDEKKKSVILEKEEKLRNSSKECIIVTSEHIQDVKHLLRKMGQKVIDSPSEGEAWCATLNRLGYVDAGITEDADFFAFGGLKLIRGLGGSGKTKEGQKKRDLNMRVYDTAKILNGMKLTIEEFIEVGILCGTDFTNNVKIPGVGPVNALKKIKEYGTIEAMIHEMKDTEKAKVPKEFVPSDARKNFYHFLKMEQLDPNYPVPENENYDHNELCRFMKSKSPQYQDFVLRWTKAILGVNPGYKTEQELGIDSPSKRKPEDKLSTTPKFSKYQTEDEKHFLEEFEDVQTEEKKSEVAKVSMVETTVEKEIQIATEESLDDKTQNKSIELDAIKPETASEQQDPKNVQEQVKDLKDVQEQVKDQKEETMTLENNANVLVSSTNEQIL